MVHFDLESGDAIMNRLYREIMIEYLQRHPAKSLMNVLFLIGFFVVAVYVKNLFFGIVTLAAISLIPLHFMLLVDSKKMILRRRSIELIDILVLGVAILFNVGLLALLSWNFGSLFLFWWPSIILFLWFDGFK